MTRYSPVPFCFCCIVTIAMALALPRIPRDPIAKKLPASPPRFTDRMLSERAAAICSLVTQPNEPVHMTMSPRPFRERTGLNAAAIEVSCQDSHNGLICFLCWDVQTGKLLIYSRTSLRGVARDPRGENAAWATEAALSWLRMTDLAPVPKGWRITSVAGKSRIRWIVRAESGDLKANIFVDRPTGAVVNVNVWRDWPQPVGQLAAVRAARNRRG